MKIICKSKIGHDDFWRENSNISILKILNTKVKISKSKHLISKHRKDSRKVKTVVHMYCSEQIICILLSCFCISLRKEGGCYLALVPLCQGDIEEEEDCEVSHDIYWLASLLLAEGLFEPPFWRNVTGVHNYVEYSIDAKNWQG